MNGTVAFFCINCKSAIEPKFKACPFCGEPITDFLRRYLETPIDGKYQILSRLGVGGMGEVYKVLHVHLNAIRVVKLMRSIILKEEGAHERFVREARLATRIQSPNVATLYDFSTMEDGAYYMVWEYIEGTNLLDLIRARGSLSPRYAAKLAIQSLLGLDAIHRAGVVHRDISPENLMLTHDEEGEERVKIIDLGIAKQWADTVDDKTKTGIFVGKWKYCSPEHLGMLKDGERIDGRADLYSFGIVVYEMLAGIPPFVADTPHRYLLLHSSETPKSINEVNPRARVPPELEAVIFRALEKDRTRRFATAREFARALEALLPSLEDVAAPAPIAAWSDAPTEEGRTLATELGHDRNEDEPQDSGTVISEVRGSEATTVEKPAPAMARPLAGRAAPVAVTVKETAPRTMALATSTLIGEVNSLEARTMTGTALPSEPAEPGRRGWMLPLVAGLSLAGLAIVGLISRGLLPLKNGELRPAALTTSASVLATPVPPAAPGGLATVAPPIAMEVAVGINAFPWGSVKTLRNLATGESVAARDLVTPATLQLRPGHYEIELSNPQFGSLRKTFEVTAGSVPVVMVEFQNGSAAPLPSFARSGQ